MRLRQSPSGGRAAGVGRSPILHLDVMDGHFVPNLSYGPMVIERLRELTELPFEAHLMISDPARYLDDFLKAGCNLLTFHLEAVPEPRPLLDAHSGARAPGRPGDQSENAGRIARAVPGRLRSGPGDERRARFRRPEVYSQRARTSSRWLKSRLKPGTFASVDGGIDRRRSPTSRPRERPFLSQAARSSRPAITATP